MGGSRGHSHSKTWIVILPSIFYYSGFYSVCGAIGPHKEVMFRETYALTDSVFDRISLGGNNEALARFQDQSTNVTTNRPLISNLTKVDNMKTREPPLLELCGLA